MYYYVFIKNITHEIEKKYFYNYWRCASIKYLSNILMFLLIQTYLNFIVLI